MTRIFLAEDHHVVREGLRALLTAQPGFEVVGEESDGLLVAERIEAARADVLVLDLSLRGLGGREVLARVRGRSPGVRVVVLTMHDDAACVAATMQAGAHGYVLKCSPSGSLVAAIRAVLRGERHLAPPISERTVAGWMRSAAVPPWNPTDALTPREHEALHLAAEGQSNPEIALRLGISVRTAEQHRANILRKLGLRNQPELVRFAVERGLVPRRANPAADAPPA